MPYGLKKEEAPGGKSYARKCDGYAQTTASTKCCGGELFIRGRDCCSNLQTWFPTLAFQCDPGAGQVFVFGQKCWIASGQRATRARIEERFPGEQIIDAGPLSIPCVTGCQDPVCPECEDCCFEVFNPNCASGSANCHCVRGPCVGGKKWTIFFQYQSDYIGNHCDNGELCYRYTSNMSGSATFEYVLGKDDLCYLICTNVGGTASGTRVYGGGRCSGAPFARTVQLADYFDEFFFVHGIGWSPISAMQNFAQIVGSIVFTDAGVGGFDGCIPFSAPDTCNGATDTGCSPTNPEQGRFKRTWTGTKGCHSGSYRYITEDICGQIDGCYNTGVFCDGSGQFHVVVNVPCEGKIIDTQGGIATDTLPGVGSTF